MKDTRIRWRDIAGFPGYQVSDDGNVRGPRGPLKPQPGHRGHLYLMIRRRKVAIHRAVLIAFVGPCPPGHECCHIDDNPTNNRVANLRWGTPQDNADDSERNGGRPHGEARPAARLTDDQVREIRRLYGDGGQTTRSLGARFGVSHTAIRHIVNRSKWSHIE